MGQAKKITERVLQVGGSSMSDGMDCSIYLVVTGTGDLVLIDTGAGPSFPILLRIIESSGHDPARITHIVLTHGHIDHIGGAPDFVERFGCKIIAHKGDADAIEGSDPAKTAADWYGVDLQPVRIDDPIDSEEASRTFGDTTLHFLHTPGHTPGSMVAYLDHGGKRVLFGQDIHGPFSPAFGSDIRRYRRSMVKLIALEADILCEGHFGVYRGKDAVREFIEGYLDQHGGPPGPEDES